MTTAKVKLREISRTLSRYSSAYMVLDERVLAEKFDKLSRDLWNIANSLPEDPVVPSVSISYSFGKRDYEWDLS